MNISVSAQTMEFLYAALFGVALGVLYDLLAVLRSYLPQKKAVTVLTDSLFWLIAAVLLLAFVLLVSGGAMRWYVLVGSFFGIFLYKTTISALFFRAIRIIISIAVKILRSSVTPLYWISGKLYHGAQRTWHAAGKRRSVRKARRNAKRGKEKEKA